MNFVEDVWYSEPMAYIKGAVCGLAIGLAIAVPILWKVFG